MKKKFTGRREFIRVYRVNGWVRAVIIRDHPNARCYTVLSDDGNDAYGSIVGKRLTYERLIAKVPA